MLSVLKCAPGSVRGASLVEYSMVVGLISVLAIGAVKNFGDEVSDVMCTATNHLGESNSTATGGVYEASSRCANETAQEFVSNESAVMSNLSAGTGETGTQADNFIQMNVPGLIEHPAEDVGWRQVLLSFTESAEQNDLFRIASISQDFQACVDFDTDKTGYGTVCRSSVDFYAEDALQLGFAYNLNAIQGVSEKSLRIENVTAGGSRLYSVTIDHEVSGQEASANNHTFNVPAGTTGNFDAFFDVLPSDYRNAGADYLVLTVDGARPALEWNHEPHVPSSLRGKKTYNVPGETSANSVENWGIRADLGSAVTQEYNETFILHVTNPDDNTDSRDITIRIVRPAQ